MCTHNLLKHCKSSPLRLTIQHFSFPSHYHTLVASTIEIFILPKSLCSHQMMLSILSTSSKSCMQTCPTLQPLQVFTDVCCRPECSSSLRELPLPPGRKEMVQLYLQLSRECRLAALSKWQPFTKRGKNSTHPSAKFLIVIYTRLNVCIQVHINNHPSNLCIVLHVGHNKTSTNKQHNYMKACSKNKSIQSRHPLTTVYLVYKQVLHNQHT